MIFLPSRAVGGSNLRADIALSVSSGCCMSGTGAGRRRRIGPYQTRGGLGEGRIVVLEGDRSDDLTVSWWGRGRPWGVSSCVCRACLVSTGPPRLLGEIFLTCVTAICQGVDSRAGLLGRSTLTVVRHDAHHGRPVCTTLVSRAAWNNICLWFLHEFITSTECNLI